MNDDTLLEQYRRNPLALRLKIEAAARRERALYINQLLKQAAAALFGTRRSRSNGNARSDLLKPLVRKYPVMGDG